MMAEYIERERLKQGISEDALNTLTSWDDSLMAMVMADIDECPTVDVAPVVHGRWERVDSPYYRVSPFGGIRAECITYRCGRCGYGTAVRTHYCPYCGARMDEEAEA